MTLAWRIRGEVMTIQQALDRCLEDIRSGGATVDDCLRRYPEFAGELRPLLRMAARLEAANDVHPSKAFKARLRQQLTADEAAPPRRSFSWKLALIWVVVSALLITALIWLGIVFEASGRISTPIPPMTLLTPSIYVRSSPQDSSSFHVVSAHIAAAGEFIASSSST